jgi:hypothetical protein
LAGITNELTLFFGGDAVKLFYGMMLVVALALTMRYCFYCWLAAPGNNFTGD